MGDNVREWENWDKGEIAQSVDQYWRNDSLEAEWRKLLVADIEAEIGRGTPILEVGCGSGVIYREMLKRGIVTAKSYIGGDVSQKMLEIARDRFPETKFTELDIFNLHYPDRSQPNVICIHVLQHLPHYAEAVKELIRIASRRLYIASWFNETSEDNIVFGDTGWGALFYENRYSLPKFLAFLYGNTEADIRSVCVKRLAKRPNRSSYSISLAFE
jgi:ubiquinone/menaquinone biosynthesis C-methylase UbiE